MRCEVQRNQVISVNQSYCLIAARLTLTNPTPKSSMYLAHGQVFMAFMKVKSVHSARAGLQLSGRVLAYHANSPGFSLKYYKQ